MFGFVRDLINVGQAAAGNVGEALDGRALNSQETEIAQSVFLNTVDYTAVRVTASVGLQSRPWTEPRLHLGGLYFMLHVGHRKDEGMQNHDGLLIHEMTHVWQGQNGLIPAGYVVNSALFQVYHTVAGGSAYSFEPGLDWDDYNVEQQASIVARWYTRGMSTTDELFPYVHQNIRGNQLPIQQSMRALSQPSLTPLQGMALRRTIRGQR